MWLLLSVALAAEPTAPAEGEHVTVATWNTWGLPAPLAPGRSWRLPKIRRSAAELGADIVAFQEVWRGARSLFEGPAMRWSPAAGDSGLALYSPHTLSELSSMAFTHGVGFDKLKRKGALRATLEREGEDVVVVTVHLQAGRSERAAGVREAQVHELLAWIGEVTGPLVLLGDVNFTGDQPADLKAVEALREAGFVDAATRVEARTATWGGQHRFDRIYARGDLEPVAVAAHPRFEALSDHLPLTAELLTGGTARRSTRLPKQANDEAPCQR